MAIEKLEKDWIQYPIFHLDLNIGKYDTPDSLDKILNDHLEQWESQYGTRPSEVTFSLRFAGIIKRACQQTGQRAVILVDEYDKPMLQAIGNEELQKEYRNTLKPFYGVLKTMDGCIKLAFLTGVTKFGKVSVFSDLNNLDDISMQEMYVGLCGVTEQEIHDNLEEELHELADAQKMTYEEACAELKRRYDGYHFVENTEGVYNPFSLLNTFKYKKFGSYWFETGTPTYLIELLKRYHYDLEHMAHAETYADVLNSIYGDEEPLPVIFQSGYLTIKGMMKSLAFTVSVFRTVRWKRDLSSSLFLIIHASIRLKRRLRYKDLCRRYVRVNPTLSSAACKVSLQIRLTNW